MIFDTRAKSEETKTIHIPLFELKNSLNEIEKVLSDKKIGIHFYHILVCLAYNENDAKYGAELFYTKGYKGNSFIYSSRHTMDVWFMFKRTNKVSW